jgi:hypothetical protein
VPGAKIPAPPFQRRMMTPWRTEELCLGRSHRKVMRANKKTVRKAIISLMIQLRMQEVEEMGPVMRMKTSL